MKTASRETDTQHRTGHHLQMRLKRGTSTDPALRRLWSADICRALQAVAFHGSAGDFCGIDRFRWAIVGFFVGRRRLAGGLGHLELVLLDDRLLRRFLDLVFVGQGPRLGEVMFEPMATPMSVVPCIAQPCSVALVSKRQSVPELCMGQKIASYRFVHVVLCRKGGRKRAEGGTLSAIRRSFVPSPLIGLAVRLPNC